MGVSALASPVEPAESIEPTAPIERSLDGPAFIDLFAGCGGLSLGLELAGFRPVFVNELDPDAMESYLVNRREDFPELDQPRGHVNDIFDLTAKDGELSAFSSHLRSVRGIKDVDLIVGGPPCQGYYQASAIAARSPTWRKLDIPSNHLYREMAKVIVEVRPKMFVFENVKGLLSSRWTPTVRKARFGRTSRSRSRSIEGYEVRPGRSAGQVIRRSSEPASGAPGGYPQGPRLVPRRDSHR